ncbi:MAG: hypothetical protein CFE32_10585 [Alphaproteobacteria bacterium PA3]|nr:MAG: hypothetical protein CFE32_10585 [Alphaproteobacteria bacterium PA3]
MHLRFTSANVWCAEARGQSPVVAFQDVRKNGAGDEIRTHDIHLGKFERIDLWLILACHSF